MHIPIWTLFIVISLGGGWVIASKATTGYLDFSGLFFLPMALCWFLFSWVIYFALFAH